MTDFYKHVNLFIKQSEEGLNQKYKHFPSPHKDLKREVKLGNRGKNVDGSPKFRKITYYAFTGIGQTIKNGIYPVIAYYRAEKLVILAYGISAKNVPTRSWNLKESLTIGDYFKSIGNTKHCNDYDSSFVFKVYNGHDGSAPILDSSFDDDVDAIVEDYIDTLKDSTFIISRGKEALEEDDYYEGLGKHKVYSEGAKRLKIHFEKERNKEVVKEAKRIFKKNYGHLFCEICKIDFLKEYGFEYIEAHHKVKAFSEYDEEHEVKPEDFMMLCPNCHTAIHHKIK